MPELRPEIGGNYPILEHLSSRAPRLATSLLTISEKLVNNVDALFSGDVYDNEVSFPGFTA